MGWFTKIDAADLDWQVQHWAWLIGVLKNRFDLTNLRLITPTESDFPVSGGPVEERALAIFQCVQKHFGMEKWPCRLEPFEEATDIVRGVVPVLARPDSSNGAAGLFQVTESREVIIRYKANQLDDPTVFIATLAHELSHYVLATVKEAPPSGWASHEPITDLTAVFFGFGIFLANSSFRFKQWQDGQYQGWSANRQGYLSETALSLALSLFCTSKNISSQTVAGFLTTNPRHYFKVYCKDLVSDHGEVLTQMRENAKIARHDDASCPGCRTAPPVGKRWFCPTCKTKFDTFETDAVCPSCKTLFPTTQCLACKKHFPISQWRLRDNTLTSS